MKSNQRSSDLKAMSTDQLSDELLNLKKEQFNLRFQRATGQLENTGARHARSAGTSHASRRMQRQKAAAAKA